jgi:RNA polymerase sigma-54 factor
MTPDKKPHQFNSELQPSLSQKLKITLQQIHNLDVLMLPSLELNDRIYQELEQNPTLEISGESEPSLSGEPGTPESEPAGPAPAEPEAPESVVEMLDDERDYASRRSIWRGREMSDRKLDAMQNTPDRPESLQDYLYFQFLLIELPESVRRVGKNIIYNIDDDGFLRTSLEDIALTNNVPVADAEKALNIIKNLDPPGIGSKNLPEYLLTQLSEDDRNVSLKRLLINQYLERLQPNKLPEIAKELGLNLETLQQAVGEIKALQAHPAAGFSSENIPYIIPDVIISRQNDDYEINVQSEYFPALIISRYYQDIISDKNADKQTLDYVRDKINAARSLIQAINMRKITLRQASREIVLAQRDFFEQGLEHLKPMMMKDMARKLGVHISTVSRVLSNKYVQTPHGLFSMKFFFSATSETADGDIYAQPALLKAIKDIVDNEDKKHPLSDMLIAEALKQKNFVIARRTIAKYRETLRIPNQSQRRIVK